MVLYYSTKVLNLNAIFKNYYCLDKFTSNKKSANFYIEIFPFKIMKKRYFSIFMEIIHSCQNILEGANF